METVLAHIAKLVEQLESVAPGVWAAAQGQARVAAAVDMLMFCVWLFAAILAIVFWAFSLRRMRQCDDTDSKGLWKLAIGVALLSLAISCGGMVALAVDYVTVTMNPNWRAIEILMLKFGVGRP